jgi:hypothetical protein
VDLTDAAADDVPVAKKTKPNPLRNAWQRASGSQPEAVVQLLTELPSAQPSVLERPRVVEVKAVAPAKQQQHVAHPSASKAMAATRLTEPEFQGQSLVLNVANREELWCKCCRKVVKSKKSIVLQHVASDGHKKALAGADRRGQARSWSRSGVTSQSDCLHRACRQTWLKRWR